MMTAKSIRLSSCRRRSFALYRLPLFVIVIIIISSSLPTAIHAQQQQQQQRSHSHDGGLWGATKDVIDPIVRPTIDSCQLKYNSLSDNGRFVTGACVGFGTAKIVIGTTIKALKTVGAAYIVFEGLEYAGILQKGYSHQTKSQQAALAHARDYVLRTVDGVRHDVRNTINPEVLRNRWNRSMKKDKAGSVGFATGAFLGFIL